MSLIKAINNLDQVAQRTYLASSVTSGGTAFPVTNINGAAASWAIQIGKTGEETAEILLLSSGAPSGTALTTTAAARFDHQPDTPVFFIKYDKIIFKRSTSGTAGTATAMTNGTITITPDGTVTAFDDTSAASSYAYKTSFYNSVLDVESSDSDWQTPAGFTFYSKAKIRQRIRGKLFDSTYIPNDDDLDDWINEWLEIMNNAAVQVNKDYSLGTVDVGFSGTAQLGTITASDYKDVRRVWMTTDGSTWYNAQKKDITGFDPNSVFTQSQPFYFFQGDNVIGRLPYDSSGTARIVYSTISDVLVNDTDELPVVMRAYSKSFVDYGEAQARKRDGKFNEASTLEAAAVGQMKKFITQITPRNSSGVTYVEMVEASSGEDGIAY